MSRLAILFLAITTPLLATDYYVRTDGDDGNDGLTDNAGGAWLHIWYAANQATAGDTVHIGAGLFNEFVTNTVSGTAGNYIIFTGTRDIDGSWLTIIDPSTSISNGWVAASEINSNVWKQTALPFTVRELTIDNKRLPGIRTLGDLGTDSIYENCSGQEWLTNGIQLLQLPPDQVLTFGDSCSYTVNFWDALGALYYSTGSVCYVRMADGSSPEGLNIRAAPNRDADPITDTEYRPAIKMYGTSYLVWSNVWVRGAFSQMQIVGYSGHTNSYTTIVSNRLENGYSRLSVNSYYPHHINIYSNRFHENYYGTTNLGAWGIGQDERAHVYQYTKYPWGGSTTFSRDLGFDYAGSTNLVVGNYFGSSSGGGFSAFSDMANHPMMGMVFANNEFHDAVSIGITLSSGNMFVRIYSNLFDNCNSQIRWNVLNVAGETNRTAYVYRNTFRLPAGYGNQHFYHYYETPYPDIYPDIWVYQNSFEGGAYALSVNSDAAPNGGVQGLRWINNIVDNCPYWGQYSNFRSNANYVAVYDYNLFYPGTHYGNLVPDWFDSHNITNNAAQWTNTLGMSFAIPSDSLAVDAGVDIPTVYPDLPWDNTVMTGTAWDIGALEYSAPPIVITNRVQYTEDLWIK